MLRFTINLLLIIFAGLLQSATWFVFMGVKPDLVMVLVLAMVISDRDWVDRLAFILIGEFMLQFGPNPDIYSLIFLGLMVVSAVVFDYVNFQQYLVLGAVTLVTTVLMNVYGHVQLSVVLTEIAYNLVLVVPIYTILSSSYGKKVYK